MSKLIKQIVNFNIITFNLQIDWSLVGLYGGLCFTLSSHLISGLQVEPTTNMALPPPFSSNYIWVVIADALINFVIKIQILNLLGSLNIWRLGSFELFFTLAPMRHQASQVTLGIVRKYVLCWPPLADRSWWSDSLGLHGGHRKIVSGGCLHDLGDRGMLERLIRHSYMLQARG